MTHLRLPDDGPVYVFETPVRLWHWLTTLSLIVLAISGYLIGSPPPSVPGEASASFLFGYIRFAHFAAGYVLAVLFLMRVYWAFVGNRYSRELFLLPVLLLRPHFWQGLYQYVGYYLFLRNDHTKFNGHNPLATVAMFGFYVLGTVFMIFTGFALYGEGTGAQSWQFTMFSSWIIPMFGQSQDVHTWHHLGMWYLILFSIVHLYMVIREDIFSGLTVISTMLNGWRISKP